MPKENADWVRDELILALDLYLRNTESPAGKTSREVRELSALLRQLGTQLGLQQGTKFRNANGVYMKLMNFRRLDPNFIRSGRSGLRAGNRLEESVWREFASDRERLHQTAETIRANISTRASTASNDVGDSIDDAFEAPEG
jgi:5-methylcytosine-specific restriction protein A